MKGMSRMAETEMLNELRTMLDTAEDDATLLSYIQQAKDVLLNRLYPYLDGRTYSDLTIPARFTGKQLQIAAYLINKRGAEGETQHIENGIHRNYQSAFVPEDMLKDVMPFVGLPR